MLGRIATFIGAGVIGLLAWNVAARVFIDYTVNSPSVKAEGEYSKMEREALAKYAGPGTPSIVAINRYAREQAAKKLAEAATPDERRFAAAQIFIGYYLTNAKARLELCQEQHVDVSNFANAFANIHQPQYERAAAVFRAKGIALEDTWSTFRRASMRAAETDMTVELGMSVVRACEELARMPTLFASQLDFANHQPDVQRALMWP